LSFEFKDIVEVVDKVKKNCEGRNFTQSIELIVNLKDIDLRKPENRIAGTLELPHPPNKPVKVCLFATGELYMKARDFKIDLILDRDELVKLAGDKRQAKKIAKNYDVFLSEASLMPLVGRTWGVYLGPRGKMPTPIPPTLDLANAIERSKRMINIRVRNQPLIQLRVGTQDMDDKQVVENIQAALNWVIGKLPKGLTNIQSVYLKGTMTPSFKLTIKR